VPVVPLVGGVPPSLSSCGLKQSLTQRSFEHRGEIIRPIPEEYAGILAWRREGGGVVAGNPDRAAEILVQVAKRRDIPRNLPLGVNATEGSILLDQESLAEDRKWSAVSRSADFAESYPVEFPPDTPAVI
jgi:hypothetical protein